MKEQEIFQKVVTIINPYVKNLPALQSATNETRFVEDLKINSARIVDIILDVEDKFGIGISDEDAEKMLTIGSSVALIAKLMKK